MLTVLEYTVVKIIIFAVSVGCIAFLFVENVKVPSFTRILSKVGERNYKAEKKLQREILIYQNKKTIESYRKYDEIITIMGLKKKGMTVTAYKFITWVVSIVIALISCVMLNITLLLMPLVAYIVHVIIYMVCKVLTASMKERRELAIMDAIDLIVSDIKSGIENSIRLYITSFDRSIRQEFEMFLMNRSRNMSFVDAIYELNYALGATFDDFAEKAVHYEIAERKGMAELFSELVDLHATKRELRSEANAIFNKLRFEFIVSLILIVTLTTGMVVVNRSVGAFYANTLIGKILLLIDVGIVIYVMSYLTIIKSSDL